LWPPSSDYTNRKDWGKIWKVQRGLSGIRLEPDASRIHTRYRPKPRNKLQITTLCSHWRIDFVMKYQLLKLNCLILMNKQWSSLGQGEIQVSTI
jgi:hypothetical protein